MDKATAQATIASVRARYADDTEVATVCKLASDHVRTWAEPRLLADLIRSQRQEEQFRIAERYGWRGGCSHLQFIPDDERAAFKAETARLIAEAGDKRVTV